MEVSIFIASENFTIYTKCGISVGWVGLENEIDILRRLLYTHTDLQSFTKEGIQ